MESPLLFSTSSRCSTRTLETRVLVSDETGAGFDLKRISHPQNYFEVRSQRTFECLLVPLLLTNCGCLFSGCCATKLFSLSVAP